MHLVRVGSNSGAALAVMAIALGAAACGPTHASERRGNTGMTTPSVVGQASPIPTAAKSNASNSMLAFSACMRSHGVTGFPDLSGGNLMMQMKNNGTIAVNGHTLSVNPSVFQNAMTTCQKYMKTQKPPAAQTAKVRPSLLRYSQCMRTHGVPNFPDQTIHDGGAMGLTLPKGLNPNSPVFKAAVKACRSLSPFPGPGAAGGPPPGP